LTRNDHIVDRIIRGDKPGDKPVQRDKFEIVNQCNARQGDRNRNPPFLLARTDEVME